MNADDREHPREEPEAAGAPGEGGPGSRGPRLRGRGLAFVLLRLALVLIVAGGVLQLQAAGSYLVPAGSVSFQLRPAWPGGHLVMPLGPAGELSLRTHHTPVDVVMDYRLPAETAALLATAVRRASCRGWRAAPARRSPATWRGACPGCSWWARRRASGGRSPDAAAPALGRRSGAPPSCCCSAAPLPSRATRPWTAHRRCAYSGTRVARPGGAAAAARARVPAATRATV